MIAEHGQGWYPGGMRMSPETYEKKSSMLKRFIQDAGRDESEVHFGIVFETMISKNKEEIKTNARKFSISTEDQKGMIMGTPKDCIVRLKDYVKSGATHISIGVKPFEKKKMMDGLQLYSEEVIPYI